MDNQMIEQVRLVLPHMPYDVIAADIARTQNVDMTINNLLMEPVADQGPFEPQPAQDDGGAPAKVARVLTDAELAALNEKATQEADATAFNTGVKIFSLYPERRELSLQERKDKLFNAARLKYLQKQRLLAEQKKTEAAAASGDPNVAGNGPDGVQGS